MESLAGAPRATVHLYNATSPFLSVLYSGLTGAAAPIAVRGAVHLMKAAEARLGGCDLGLESSPEVFTDTELDFAIEVCSKVADIWQPGPGREIILNFPATVERATPNVFADQVEWISRHLPYREHTCLSVRPMTAARASQPLSLHCWPARSALKAACSVTASGAATSAC